MNYDMQRLQQTRIIKVCQNDWLSRKYRPMLPVSDWNTLRMQRVTKQPSKMINAVK